MRERQSRPFPDHFSAVSAGYARSRPRYPDALFEWLATLARHHRLAWDAGTGNGQAATGLAAHFAAVIATDASAAQVARAEAHPAVTYRVGLAEQSGLPDASVDLVTAAQAAHWFDLDAFHAEVHRVLAPGGAVALWSYALPRLDDPEPNAELAAFAEQMAPWWPPERRLVETGYATMPFPFDEVRAPAFDVTAEWNLDQLLTYLRTWSSVTRAIAETGADPVAAAGRRLARFWGAEGLARQVRWPVSVRAGWRLQRTASRRRTE